MVTVAWVGSQLVRNGVGGVFMLEFFETHDEALQGRSGPVFIGVFCESVRLILNLKPECQQRGMAYEL